LSSRPWASAHSDATRLSNDVLDVALAHQQRLLAASLVSARRRVVASGGGAALTIQCDKWRPRLGARPLQPARAARPGRAAGGVPLCHSAQLCAILRSMI